MSSYIDVVHPERHAPYLDIPDDVVDYLHYLDFVKLRSPRTVNGYYLDLRGFFRYMMQRWQRVADDTPLEEIDLTGITTADIRTITKHDIFDFLDHARSADNGPKARARKLSALKGFFNYMCTQVNRLPANPTENISLGSPARSLPKYLTRDEAVTLLSNIQSDFYERDYCILTLFLNCGMRLAEELFRAVRGRAARETPGTARRLAVRFAAALALSAAFAAVGAVLAVMGIGGVGR